VAGLQKIGAGETELKYTIDTPAYFRIAQLEGLSSPFFISTSISAPHFKHLTLPLKFQCLWLPR
jgi:hypothetical protein